MGIPRVGSREAGVGVARPRKASRELTGLDAAVRDSLAAPGPPLQGEGRRSRQGSRELQLGRQVFSDKIKL